MAKTTKGIDAEFDRNYQYKKYTVDAIASYFKVSKADVHETVDFGDRVMTIPLLEEQHNFRHVVAGAHMDRKKLNLDIFITPRKFVASTIYEEFLETESFVSSGKEGSFIFCIHVGGLILAMYRDHSVEGDAGIFINTPDEGGFVIEHLKEYLKREYPPEDVD